MDVGDSASLVSAVVAAVVVSLVAVAGVVVSAIVTGVVVSAVVAVVVVSVVAAVAVSVLSMRDPLNAEKSSQAFIVVVLSSCISSPRRYSQNI